MHLSTLIVIALLSAGEADASTSVRPRPPGSNCFHRNRHNINDGPTSKPEESGLPRNPLKGNNSDEENLIGVPPVKLRSGGTHPPEVRGRRRRRGSSGTSSRPPVAFIRDDDVRVRGDERRKGEDAPLPRRGGDEKEECEIPSLRDSVDTPLIQGGMRGLLRVPCHVELDSASFCDDRDDPRLDDNALGDAPVSPPRGTPLSAYVDTGAQVTVISTSAARRAGLLHLLDRRYAGRATGVGHCGVLGRIPAGHARLVLGDGVTTVDSPQLTVLEGTGTEGIDLLLGLDVLDEWNASICLRRRTLTMEAGVATSGQRRPGAWNGGLGGKGSTAKRRVVIPFAREGAAQGSRRGEVSSTSHRRKSTPRASEFAAVSAASSGGTSSRSSHERRGRTTYFMDEDLQADLEWLEQESSSGSASSDGGWIDDVTYRDDADDHIHDDIYSDDADEEEDYDDNFDMSGV